MIEDNAPRDEPSLSSAETSATYVLVVTVENESPRPKTIPKITDAITLWKNPNIPIESPSVKTPTRIRILLSTLSANFPNRGLDRAMERI